MFRFGSVARTTALGVLVLCTAHAPAMADGGKKAAVARIDAAAGTYWQAALDIWGWAEPGYQETLSSERLKRLLRDGGFTIEEGVAGIPTAFVAAGGPG